MGWFVLISPLSPDPPLWIRVLTPVRAPSPREIPIRYIAVIDGEHYPPVISAALQSLRERGHEIARAVLVGGREKLPAEGLPSLEDLQVDSGDVPAAVLSKAIEEVRPDAIVDLSDEPVLDYRRRFELASVALWHGTAYEGADFSFAMPDRPKLCTSPSIAVIGTGKRTGKTSVSGALARGLVARGHHPVIVAMGRGGPPDPEVLKGDELELRPADLLELADGGMHAASDYVEDALLGRVPTVGCRRCGGGLAGGVDITNLAEGIAKANDLDGDITILEGSGSSIPPAHADATLLVVPASIPEEYLSGYFGPYRLLLADVVVVTMCENPFGSPSQISSITSQARHSLRSVIRSEEKEIQLVRTVFRPTPTREVQGTTAIVATTAPETAGATIRRHLEEEHGCEIKAISHSLSDRSKLLEELDAGGGDAQVLLCEIKAAGIDVATRWALDKGLDVVYMDNVPHPIEGDDLDSAFDHLATLARSRMGKEN
ncbi:MAG TPA: cyclic 2,3-diphosphoglycerate synthetase [Actinomycetota bacterium]|nr:cyclic 2,3-diphosphoglycerate synthetase [Actinomycetota bacterium]